MSKSIQTVQTEHHTVEIDPVDYQSIVKHCKKIGITTDYYFFEFQNWEDEDYDLQ
tara:strand:- start:296 stop:460 length:165 start_codon:yes stop_codon:yes gene_type:complete